MSCNCFYKIFFIRKPQINKQFDYGNIRRRYRFFIHLLKKHAESTSSCSEQISQANDLYNQAVMIVSDRSLEKTYRFYGKIIFRQIFDHVCYKATKLRHFMLDHIIRERSCEQNESCEFNKNMHKEQGLLSWIKDKNSQYDDHSLLGTSTNQLLQPGQFLVGNDYYDESLKENIPNDNDDESADIITRSLNTPDVSPVGSPCWSDRYEFMLMEDGFDVVEQTSASYNESNLGDETNIPVGKLCVNHVDLFYSSDEEADESQEVICESNKECFISDDGTKHVYRQLLNSIMLLSHDIIDQSQSHSNIDDSQRNFHHNYPASNIGALREDRQDLFIPPNQIAIPIIESILRHRFVNRKTVWTIRWINANGGVYVTEESTDSILFAKDIIQAYLNLLIDASPKLLYRLLLVDKFIFSHFRQYLLVKLTNYPIERAICRFKS